MFPGKGRTEGYKTLPETELPQFNLFAAMKAKGDGWGYDGKRGWLQVT
jgi:hypothetical protein